MDLTREKIAQSFKKMAFETHLEGKEELEINEDGAKKRKLETNWDDDWHVV